MNSENLIDTIMLFAAGRGTRMQHLTAQLPKSLISVCSQPILYYALDLCKNYKFKKIVINTHYFHEEITSSLERYQNNNPDFPYITNIYEEELLETGGAIKNAAALLGSNPIFTLNTDIILKADYNIFTKMAEFWNPYEMNFLLLMQPYDEAIGYSGKGDFELDKDNRVKRPELNNSEHYSYMYAGLSILKPERVASNPLKTFSLKDYYLKDDRVFGIKAENAKWYHATYPEDLLEIERDIRALSSHNK